MKKILVWDIPIRLFHWGFAAYGSARFLPSTLQSVAVADTLTLMRVLLAEDQLKVAAHLARGLREAGYAVDISQDGDDALWLARNHPYDAMVLDVTMPGKDGITVVRHLRKEDFNTPAIMASAKGEVQDRIHGLDAGADDFLVKPFSLAELLARLRAVLRRSVPLHWTFFTYIAFSAIEMPSILQSIS